MHQITLPSEKIWIYEFFLSLIYFFTQTECDFSLRLFVMHQSTLPSEKIWNLQEVPHEFTFFHTNRKWFSSVFFLHQSTLPSGKVWKFTGFSSWIYFFFTQTGSDFHSVFLLCIKALYLHKSSGDSRGVFSNCVAFFFTQTESDFHSVFLLYIKVFYLQKRSGILCFW